MNNSMRKSLRQGSVIAAKERIKWVDGFRAWMIFLIVLGHALGMKASADGVLARYLYSFHVPAFFFISGYLFNRGTGGFFCFLKRKVISLVLPYFFYSIMSIFVFTVLGSVVSAGLNVSIKTTELLPNILGMLYGNGATGYMKWNLPLWFLPCAFVSQIFFYWIALFTEKSGNGLVPMGIALFVCCGVAFLNYYLMKWHVLFFGIETALYMLPFIMLGYAWRNAQIGHRQSLKTACVLAVALLLVGIGVGVFAQPRIDYPTSRYASLPLFYISAVATVLGCAMLFKRFSFEKLGYMGRNTLVILGLHKFPVVFMQLLMSATVKENEVLATVVGIVIATVACGASLLAGWIFEKVSLWVKGKFHFAATEESQTQEK